MEPPSHPLDLLGDGSRRSPGHCRAGLFGCAWLAERRDDEHTHRPRAYLDDVLSAREGRLCEDAPPCLRTSVCSTGFVPPDVSDDAVESVELEAEDEAVADEAVADSFVDADTPAEGDASDAPEVLAAELADPPSDEELTACSASIEFCCCAQAANRQLPCLAWDGRHTCSICRYRSRRISVKINPSSPSSALKRTHMGRRLHRKGDAPPFGAKTQTCPKGRIPPGMHRCAL